MIPYLNLLQHIRDRGIPHEDRTGVGTLSVFGYQFRHNMADGFPLLTTKKVPPRWVFEEWAWMRDGHTDERLLRAKKVDIWQEWATAEKCAKFGREEGDLGPVYGWQLRHFGADYMPLHWSTPRERSARIHGKGKDQLWDLLYNLERNPYSRRHIVSMWNPMQADQVELPPCHTLWQVKVEGPVEELGIKRPRLSLELFARSIDSFLGLPFNIAHYAFWLAILAHVCDFDQGQLIISFGDVHIYRNHMKQVEEQLSRHVQKLPKLVINERLRGMALNGLVACNWDDIEVQDYHPAPSISAPVAV